MASVQITCGSDWSFLSDFSVFSFCPFSFLLLLCMYTHFFIIFYFLYFFYQLHILRGCVFFLLIQIWIAFGNKQNYFKLVFFYLFKSMKSFLRLAVDTFSAPHPLNKISSFFSISSQSFPCPLTYLFIQQIESPLHARHCSRCWEQQWAK